MKRSSDKFESLTVAELRNQLEQKQINTDGLKKKELVELMRQHQSYADSSTSRNEGDTGSKRQRTSSPSPESTSLKQEVSGDSINGEVQRSGPDNGQAERVETPSPRTDTLNVVEGDEYDSGMPTEDDLIRLGFKKTITQPHLFYKPLQQHTTE
ncbi:hypothetical protein MIR68_009072 [Amoeboaphelidium protococcarum]|nr:hypothetical protein MIR68_009072 [Amoeboaphelidium protococcarum]KAI3648771.1 hypothetical protein MP228_006625 [Amoeboaphelidium protococcarum]